MGTDHSRKFRPTRASVTAPVFLAALLWAACGWASASGSVTQDACDSLAAELALASGSVGGGLGGGASGVSPGGSVGQVNTYGISGRVHGADDSGVAGVTMTGLPGDPVTEADGTYTATVDEGWSGTAMPLAAGLECTPPRRVYEDVVADQADEDYLAQELGFAPVHVDKDQTENPPDGASWETAFPSMQTAIDAAYAAGGGEVWVREGVYDEVRANDTGSLVLHEGVHVYGGFGGFETARNQVEPGLRETVIDGAAALAGEPAYHVVVGADDATLDGFVVTGGAADGEEAEAKGGGLYSLLTSPTVAHCTFVGNTASIVGGGAYLSHSSAVVTDCEFGNNTAGGRGGGMYVCHEDAAPVITRCAFALNVAGTGGGGLFIGGGSPATVTACTFAGNTSDDDGGAMGVSDSSPTITDCVFDGNTAATDGGGLRNAQASPAVTGCTFVGNTAAYGGGMSNKWGGGEPRGDRLRFQ